jgi:large conductance mechanosensitive channel
MTDFITFFTSKGNVIDVASGQILGGGVAKASTSLVTDIISPCVTVVTGGSKLDNHFVVVRRGPKYPYSNVSQAEEDGAVVIKYGNLVVSIFNLMIQAIALYVLIGAWRRCVGGVCRRH